MPAEELPPRSSDRRSPMLADDFRLDARTPGRVSGVAVAARVEAPPVEAPTTQAPGP